MVGLSPTEPAGGLLERGTPLWGVKGRLTRTGRKVETLVLDISLMG
jgi:hypothetical protein